MNTVTIPNPEELVLIVDDESDICHLLSSLLQTRNFKTGTVSSLSEAAISIETKKPSLVFLDNRLPDGNGIDFIPYIKRHYPDIKVVLITAFDSSQEIRKAYEMGADLFMGKPFDLKTLQAAIENLS